MDITVYPRGVLFSDGDRHEYYNLFGRLIVATFGDKPFLCQRMDPLFDLPDVPEPYVVTAKHLLLCVGQEYDRRKIAKKRPVSIRSKNTYHYEDPAECVIYNRGVLVRQKGRSFYWTFFGELLWSSDKYDPPFLEKLQAVVGPFELETNDWIRMNQLMQCIRTEELRFRYAQKKVP